MHAMSPPIVTVTLGIANGSGAAIGERGAAATWIAASFGQGWPISQSTGEMASSRGEGIARQTMGENGITQRATAPTAQPDPKKKEKRKRKHHIWCLFPIHPLSRPKQTTHLKRAVAATRASAYCWHVACSRHEFVPPDQSMEAQINLTQLSRQAACSPRQPGYPWTLVGLELSPCAASSCQGLGGEGRPYQARGPGSLGAALVARLPSHPWEPHLHSSGLAGDFLRNNFVAGVSCRNEMASETIKGPVA